RFFQTESFSKPQHYCDLHLSPQRAKLLTGPSPLPLVLRGQGCPSIQPYTSSGKPPTSQDRGQTIFSARWKVRRLSTIDQLRPQPFLFLWARFCPPVSVFHQTLQRVRRCA